MLSKLSTSTAQNGCGHTLGQEKPALLQAFLLQIKQDRSLCTEPTWHFWSLHLLQKAWDSKSQVLANGESRR